MPGEITNYQCPACTGPLHFAGESGRLECEYCGSSYSVEEIEALYAGEAAEAAPEEAAAGWDEEGMHSYSCPSCGAELLCDENTAATSCPYCGNPSIVPGQFSGSRRPDYVLPFKLSRDAAVAALKKFYKGKILLPKSFTAEAQIEKIQGVYVPFWLYDFDAEGEARYEGIKRSVRTTANERITITEYYDVYRAGRMSFERVPVDSSTKMPDEYMDAIEPYDYGELKEFSMAYMPGYLADKYDLSAEEGQPRAESRIKSSVLSALSGTVHGYSSHSQRQGNVSLSLRDASYAMMPVWLLSTKWHDQSFLFAMNGQSGKLVGNLPVSMGRFWGLFAAIAAPVAALVALLL